jgi:hypothetical protein
MHDGDQPPEHRISAQNEYFACPEVAGSAERDLRGCVWPLSCPPDRQADSAGWPGGAGQRPPGRQGSAVAPACLIPRGPAPPAPTYSVARNGSPCPTRIQDRGGAKFCGQGRARFVRVRTREYTGERGPRPGGTGRAASCAGRLRDIVLQAYAAKTPGRIAAGLSGSPPGRIAGGLPWTDRPVRSVGALLLTERAVAPLSQPSTPGSRAESSPRPTRRAAAQGHTRERL